MKEILGKLCAKIDLTETEAAGAMDTIMAGEASAAQIAAFLVAIKMKGETVAEIYGCAEAMRRRMEPVNSGRQNITDTCGTGGDGKATFNISTAAALVAAGAGLAVAKHGNRAVSSRCGSADVLEELGVNLKLTAEAMGKCLDETGIAFLYAPALHKAMRYAAGPRTEIGVRSLFNLLGPLTNPAGAKRQLIGVYAPRFTAPLAEALLRLGAERALVVHGSDGEDELTLAGETYVHEVKNGAVIGYTINPEQVGLSRADRRSVSGGSPKENAALISAILQGQTGPPLDVVLLNAGAALYVGGLAADLSEGVRAARRAVENGAALEKLNALKRFTGGADNA
jgi:anthranilate phosphoribosyltransferase